MRPGWFASMPIGVKLYSALWIVGFVGWLYTSYWLIFH